jgi:hypothetical protein
MRAATSDSPASGVTKGARNRWWFFGTIVLPACLIGAGGLWLAYSVAQYRSEVSRLQADAQQAKEELAKTRGELAESRSDLGQLVQSLGSLVGAETTSLGVAHKRPP